VCVCGLRGQVHSLLRSSKEVEGGRQTHEHRRSDDGERNPLILLGGEQGGGLYVRPAKKLEDEGIRCRGSL
jgi:transposase